MSISESNISIKFEKPALPIHYMIDIETLGTGSDCIVLSIALVKFNETDILDSMVLYPNIYDQEKRGRKIEIDTLSWWMKNEQLLKESLNEKWRTLNFCYHQIQFFLNAKDDQTRIWSKSPSFDLLIINHLFKDWRSPISEFRMEADVRTAELKLKQKSIPIEKPSQAHNPLQDALAQAKNVQNFLKL